jgi:hypothetical protein
MMLHVAYPQRLLYYSCISNDYTNGKAINKLKRPSKKVQVEEL